MPEQPEYECVTCEDSGWVEVADRQSARCPDCTSGRRWVRVAPPRFHDVHLEQLDESVRVELGDWARLPAGRNVVLIGPTGTGKTHAALAAARVRVDAGDDVMFVTASDAIALRRPGGDPTQSARLTSCDVLVLDDVGAERSTDWSDSAMYDLVNRRTMDMAPTIITSNLEPNALADHLGARLYSRLVGDRAVTLRLSGDDRRREGA